MGVTARAARTAVHAVIADARGELLTHLTIIGDGPGLMSSPRPATMAGEEALWEELIRFVGTAQLPHVAGAWSAADAVPDSEHAHGIAAALVAADRAPAGFEGDLGVDALLTAAGGIAAAILHERINDVTALAHELGGRHRLTADQIRTVLAQGTELDPNAFVRPGRDDVGCDATDRKGPPCTP